MKNESLNLLSVTKCVPGCVNEAGISGLVVWECHTLNKAGFF